MTLRYNPIDLEAILRESSPQPPFPPVSDRPSWDGVRARLGEEKTAAFIGSAEQAASEPIPALSATLWLECKRTGERQGYERLWFKRRTMMRDLVVGECLEHQGRFLDPLMDVIWAICEESSWVYPAHHTELADFENPYIDLGAAGTAFELAEAAALIGEELPREVVKRIRDEMNRRIFTPYLSRHDFWWLYNQRTRQVNNWTAVCDAGVMASALYLEDDPARLADILAKGISSLEDYLTTFDADGGSTEGPGYWSYGFGHYVLIAQLLEQQTDGKVSLMAGEFIRKIAAFPLRTMLSPGIYANFSDAPRYATFHSAMLTYLGRRLELPELLNLAAMQPALAPDDFTWLVRALFWDVPPASEQPVIPAKHDWYPGMMWMFSRADPSDPDALVLAAKGGHNQEMHNQNDVGNFIVHAGQESLIADLGSARYTLQYFGSERHSFLCASSLGHSVPVPNGQLQQEGLEFRAHLLDYSTASNCDTLRLDLKDAYPPEAGLARLERCLMFHRQSASGKRAAAGWVELEDSFSFGEKPGSFESALITFGKVSLGEGAVLLEGQRAKLRVSYDSQQVDARVDLYQDVNLSDGVKNVYRVVFALLQPQTEGKIHLEIVPV